MLSTAWTNLPLSKFLPALRNMSATVREPSHESHMKSSPQPALPHSSLFNALTALWKSGSYLFESIQAGNGEKNLAPSIESPSGHATEATVSKVIEMPTPTHWGLNAWVLACLRTLSQNTGDVRTKTFWIPARLNS